jgi:SMI1-KNR4 cell-wall
MAISTWGQLPHRLELLVRSDEAIDKPSQEELDATLDDYEMRAGFSLPTSYREFMHWFGPGDLSVWFQLSGPVPPRFRDQVPDVYDIDKQREMLENPEGYWASSVSPEVLRRFVLFASTEGGDWFFWDTADVRDEAGHEYGVYGHAHENGGGEVELVATTFKSFVAEVGLGERYPFSGNERELEWSFWPAWPRKKQRRGKRV